VIEGIVAGIEREQSVRHVVQVSSTQETIAQLSAALTRMREQRDAALEHTIKPGILEKYL
jgi:hypothetical protein